MVKGIKLGSSARPASAFSPPSPPPGNSFCLGGPLFWKCTALDQQCQKPVFVFVVVFKYRLSYILPLKPAKHFRNSWGHLPREREAPGVTSLG